VSDRGDSRRPGQWDRETSRSSYGRTEERGRSSYEDRGRSSYEDRGRPSYAERGRPSHGQPPSERSSERPSQNNREEESEGFERPRSVEAGGRRKHEEWKPTRTGAKASRFNFDISDGSDEDFASTISSDDDIDFADETEDSEPEERISTRGSRGAPEKGYRGGRPDDRSEPWNSAVSRVRSQSEPPSTRGRNRREPEFSSSGDEEDFEGFEDMDFGDEDDDEEDRAVSSSRGGPAREFTRGWGSRGGRGSSNSGAGRSRAPWARDGGSMESRGNTPFSRYSFSMKSTLYHSLHACLGQIPFFSNPVLIFLWRGNSPLNHSACHIA
jgi:hypothetical protein